MHLSAKSRSPRSTRIFEGPDGSDGSDGSGPLSKFKGRYPGYGWVTRNRSDWHGVALQDGDSEEIVLYLRATQNPLGCLFLRLTRVDVVFPSDDVLAGPNREAAWTSIFRFKFSYEPAKVLSEKQLSFDDDSELWCIANIRLVDGFYQTNASPEAFERFTYRCSPE